MPINSHSFFKMCIQNEILVIILKQEESSDSDVDWSESGTKKKRKPHAGLNTFDITKTERIKRDEDAEQSSSEDEWDLEKKIEKSHHKVRIMSRKQS